MQRQLRKGGPKRPFRKPRLQFEQKKVSTRNKQLNPKILQPHIQQPYTPISTSILNFPSATPISPPHLRAPSSHHLRSFIPPLPSQHPLQPPHSLLLPANPANENPFLQKHPPTSLLRPAPLAPFVPKALPSHVFPSHPSPPLASVWFKKV